MPAPISDPPKDGQLPDRQEWQSLLDEFRLLGGVAENVELRQSASGLTLFPVDPARPILLRAEDNILFRPKDIALEGGRIRLTESTGMRERERAFFERYHAALSRNGGGRAACARLIDLFDGLDPDLRTRLAADFGLHLFITGDRQGRILRLFLSSRSIRRRRESILAPFLDLMKRSLHGLPASTGPRGSLEIRGEAQGEIFLAFEHHDALGIFKKHGVARPRQHAFSLATHIKTGELELAIERNPLSSEERLGMRLPLMRLASNTIHLSYLTLGNAKFPRTPRAMFYALMREARVNRPEDVFDRILYVNRTRFLSLLEALEPHSGELVSRLRKVALFQLAALAECVGTREL